MWVHTLLALLLCAVCFSLCSHIPLWVYHFVDQNLTWSEAQQFCRQHYNDLVCVSSSEDNLRLPRPPGYSAPVWIGLYDDPTDLSRWKWWATNTTASFQDWISAKDEPRYVHEDRQCAAVTSKGWHSTSCHKIRQVLCYSGSTPKVFHFKNNYMTFDDALTYCRTHYTDLAIIESATENTAAVSASYPWVPWIGLYRSTGKWSDDRMVTFTTWYELSGRTIYHEPFCAAENEHNSWEVFSCQERRPFYCQEESKAQSVVKMKFSGHGLDDPAMNQQVLDEIRIRFEAAGRTDVNIKWTIVPEQEEEKDDKPKINCPLNV